jgi:DHA2 family multidrug resistance protein
VLIDFDEPDLSLLAKFDWTGLFSMAAFLGAMEYFLEEGPSKDWFESDWVFWAAIVSVVGGAVFFMRAFTAPQPIVDLEAFKDRNFWTGSLLSFVLGVGLYGLTYLYPVYLARVRGYTALMIGETMFVTGVCMFIAAPIVGRLAAKVDPRILIAVGFAGFAMGTFQASFITKDWDFYELLIPQVLRGFSLMLCMVPTNNLALGTLPPQRLKNASGLYNLTRNLGGAVGLALINTLMNNRMDLHLQRLHDSVQWARVQAGETLNLLQKAVSPLGSDAELGAVKKLAGLVRQQALVMALSDVLAALTVVFMILVLLVPIMRKPQKVTAGAGGH